MNIFNIKKHNFGYGDDIDLADIDKIEITNKRILMEYLTDWLDDIFEVEQKGKKVKFLEDKSVYKIKIR